MRVVARRAADSVVVEVVDNGPGIPAELLPNVFERFAKDPASPGSGLGLAIARDLVQAHGGTIEALSAPGQGTTIRFSLPRAVLEAGRLLDLRRSAGGGRLWVGGKGPGKGREIDGANAPT